MQGHAYIDASYTERFEVGARGGAKHGWGYTWPSGTVFHHNPDSFKYKFTYMHWLKWKLRGGKMYVQRCALVGGRGPLALQS